MKLSHAIHISFVLSLLLIFTTCRQSHTPKPSAYLKVEYPERSYMIYDDLSFCSMEIPTYARVEREGGRGMEKGWTNVHIPALGSTIHLSYKEVDDNLKTLITDSRELVYKHTVKAQGIEETPFIHREANRFGMLYDLKGDVASAVQFFVTDSSTHFLRASLYFNCKPNRDSLNPVIDFLREDMVHMIETCEWKY